MKFDQLDLILYLLAGLYLVLIFFPIIQLIRINARGATGWSTQKSFFCLIFISSTVRATFFLLVPWLGKNNFFMVQFKEDPLFAILDTLPALLFFSTYTLLIIFWAEIIQRARDQSASFRAKKGRKTFVLVNVSAYVILIILWLLLFFFPDKNTLLDIILNSFLCFLYIGAAVGFVMFGGKLYLILKQFPIESRGRKSKLREVGLVAAICTTCFAVRVIFLILLSADKSLDLNDAFIILFYLIVEVIPSTLILIILRKLPSKKDNRYERLPQHYANVN